MTLSSPRMFLAIPGTKGAKSRVLDARWTVVARWGSVTTYRRLEGEKGRVKIGREGFSSLAEDNKQRPFLGESS